MLIVNSTQFLKKNVGLMYIQINAIIPESEGQRAEQAHVEGEVAVIKVKGVKDVRPITCAQGSLIEPKEGQNSVIASF